jgi:hypothetical protein
MASAAGKRKPPGALDSLWVYVDSYSSTGVQKLLRRYSYDIRPTRKVTG